MKKAYLQMKGRDGEVIENIDHIQISSMCGYQFLVIFFTNSDDFRSEEMNQIVVFNM
jgi:hypothetical protein